MTRTIVRSVMAAGVLTVLAGAAAGLWSVRPVDPSPAVSSPDTADVSTSTAVAARPSTTPPPSSTSSLPASPTTSPATVAPLELTPSSTTMVPPTSLAPTEAPTPSVGPGSDGVAVREVQEKLNSVTAANLEVDGLYGPATTAAVSAVQSDHGLVVSGVVDAETRWVLWSLPTLAQPAPPAAVQTTPQPPPPVSSTVYAAAGCAVSLVGDSLVSSSESTYADALRAVGCSALVDGVGSRSLWTGWQCRQVAADGSSSLKLFDSPLAGAACDPSGLRLLSQWAESSSLGSVVVVALGTNDAGLFSAQLRRQHWSAALTTAAGRPVVFVTTAARPGSDAVGRQQTYSSELRAFCSQTPNCVVADWASQPAAADPASYSDSVHVTAAASRVRAAFVAGIAASVSP